MGRVVGRWRGSARRGCARYPHAIAIRAQHPLCMEPKHYVAFSLGVSLLYAVLYIAFLDFEKHHSINFEVWWRRRLLSSFLLLPRVAMFNGFKKAISLAKLNQEHSDLSEGIASSNAGTRVCPGSSGRFARMISSNFQSALLRESALDLVVPPSQSLKE